MEDYKKKAIAFLLETKTEYKALFVAKKKYFPSDTQDEQRDVWQIVLSNPKGSYSFTFGDSIANTQKSYERGFRNKPSAYDILACLQTSEPDGDVDSFAADMGITKPSEAIRTHKAIMDEWEGVQNLFTPAEIEKLQEIN